MAKQSGWQQQRPRNVAMRMAERGGKIETDVDQYNKKIRTIDDRHFSANRRRVDDHNFNQRLAKSLAEVWD